MENHSFVNSCINEVVDGLRDGLTHFSAPCRTALIYAIDRKAPLRIHDPYNLLRGHEPRLEELYLDTRDWRDHAPDPLALRYVGHAEFKDDQIHLTGLVLYSCWSRGLFFQTWFTEQHFDMCCVGPTECWLEYAARLLARNLASERAAHLGTSGYVLQEYATHAVRDYIVDLRNVRIGWDTRLRIFPILDAVLGISKTVEEGEHPRGSLAFVEPGALSTIAFTARFPRMERPQLSNFKHVRKLLLAVENSRRKLVSDGRNIIGITVDRLPEGSLDVDFRGSYGFLRLDNDLVCSFSDGRFHSSTLRANLVQVEEALLESDIDPTTRHDLYQRIAAIVHSAGRREHGCTIVIDPGDPPLDISGHKLEEPLDLRDDEMLELAKSLGKVDGALHIGADIRLYGFACLLDGHAVPGESRARGARFNSALRFTAEHPDLMVVVVSADRPVSVIQGGVELTAQWQWKPLGFCTTSPPTLAEWIMGDDDANPA